MQGGGSNDVLLGEAGNEEVEGFAGDDSILSSDGIDTLSGGADDDTIKGQGGRDYMYGDAGNDLFDAVDSLSTADYVLNGGPHSLGDRAAYEDADASSGLVTGIATRLT